MTNGRKIFLKWGLTDKQKFIFVRFSLCFCLPIFAEVGAKLLELNNLTEFPGFQRRGFETENFTWWDTWSNASTPTSELQSDKIWLKLWSPAVIMSAADLTNGNFYRQKFWFSSIAELEWSFLLLLSKMFIFNLSLRLGYWGITHSGTPLNKSGKVFRSTSWQILPKWKESFHFKIRLKVCLSNFSRKKKFLFEILNTKPGVLFRELIQRFFSKTRDFFYED